MNKYDNANWRDAYRYYLITITDKGLTIEDCGWTETEMEEHIMEKFDGVTYPDDWMPILEGSAFREKHFKETKNQYLEKLPLEGLKNGQRILIYGIIKTPVGIINESNAWVNRKTEHTLDGMAGLVNAIAFSSPTPWWRKIFR